MELLPLRCVPSSKSRWATIDMHNPPFLWHVLYLEEHLHLVRPLFGRFFNLRRLRPVLLSWWPGPEGFGHVCKGTLGLDVRSLLATPRAGEEGPGLGTGPPRKENR